MDEQAIIDGLKTICICKGIRKKVFLQHIRAGAKSLEELQTLTGAGSGGCGGQRCTPRLIEILDINRNS